MKAVAHAPRPLIAGAVFATAAVPVSAMPFLIERRIGDQVMVTGATAGAAFGIGAGVESVAVLAARRGVSPAIARAGLASVGAALVGVGLVANRGDGSPNRTAAKLETTGTLLAAGVAAAAIGAGLLRSTSSLRVRGVTPTAVAGVAAASAVAGGTAWVLADEPQRHLERDAASRSAIATTAALTGLATVGTLAGGALAYRTGSRAIARRLPFARGSLAVQGGVSLVGGTALFGLYQRAANTPSRPLKPLEVAGTEPTNPKTMARPAAGTPAARFLDTTSTPSSIRALTGRAPLARPIRVHAGDTAIDTPSQREHVVASAMRELDAQRAFERKHLVVYVPTGGGGVYYPAVVAAEHLTRGDVATVTLDYSEQPHLVAAQRSTAAIATYELLLGRIAERVRALPAAERPRLAVIGYSLGAWIGSDAFAQADLQGVDARALWLGTPGASRHRAEQLDQGDTATVRAATVQEAQGAIARAGSSAREVALEHPDDPVLAGSWAALYDRRDVARSMPGVDTSPWVPIVTGLHALADMWHAGHLLSAGLRPAAHDYRTEMVQLLPEVLGTPVEAPVRRRVEAHARELSTQLVRNRSTD